MCAQPAARQDVPALIRITRRREERLTRRKRDAVRSRFNAYVYIESERVQRLGDIGVLPSTESSPSPLRSMPANDALRDGDRASGELDVDAIRSIAMRAACSTSSSRAPRRPFREQCQRRRSDGSEATARPQASPRNRWSDPVVVDVIDTALRRVLDHQRRA